MRSNLTTLCYIEKDDSYLMLHRVKKEADINKDKWIGVGGHFEAGESPEECLLREVMEETGLTFLEAAGRHHLRHGHLRHRVHVPLYGGRLYRNVGGVRRGHAGMGGEIRGLQSVHLGGRRYFLPSSGGRGGVLLPEADLSGGPSDGSRLERPKCEIKTKAPLKRGAAFPDWLRAAPMQQPGVRQGICGHLLYRWGGLGRACCFSKGCLPEKSILRFGIVHKILMKYSYLPVA